MGPLLYCWKLIFKWWARSIVGSLLQYKLMFLCGGPPLILLEAEDCKWWAPLPITIPMYYKLMFSSGGLPLSLVEAYVFKWWAPFYYLSWCFKMMGSLLVCWKLITLSGGPPFLYKLMFIWRTLLSLYSINKRGAHHQYQFLWFPRYIHIEHFQWVHKRGISHCYKIDWLRFWFLSQAETIIIKEGWEYRIFMIS